MKKLFFTLIIIIINIQDSSAQNSEKYTVTNLESNQAYPDKGVSFFDDDFVVFSAQIENTLGKHSRRKRRNKKKEIKLLPQNLNFYFTPIDENGNFINSQKLNNVINSEYDDYGLSFSKDQSVVYFSREIIKKNSKENHLELFRANVISPGSWINIEKLSISHPNYSVGYPCLSEDDKTLYYVSNKEGNFNIYKVAVESSGVVGIPTKLSSSINSSSNETTPFVLNNKLYFSSDRSGGLGGFDIYSIDLNDEKSKALRIEAPINSPFDDFNYIKKHSNQGFFVSNRPGGKGKEDIYFFKEIDNSSSMLSNKELDVIKNVQDEEEKVLANNNDTSKLISNSTNVQPEIVKANGNKNLQDKDEKVIASNKKNKSKLILNSTNIQPEIVQSNNDEVLTSPVIVKEKVKYIKNDTVYDYQRRNSYDIKKEKVLEHLNEPLIIKDKTKDEYSKCQMEFDRLSNVYFDYSESYIRADAAIELDKVIRVMRICPKIKVIAASHTDSRASYDYNLGLSQKRSMNVVNYIIKNGKFSPDRIIGIGYGESRLTNGCSDGVRCTEKQHQLNRRTHFEIFNY